MGHYKDTSVEVTFKGEKIRIAKSDKEVFDAKFGKKPKKKSKK